MVKALKIFFRGAAIGLFIGAIGLALLVRAVAPGSVTNPSFTPLIDDVVFGRWTPLSAFKLGALPGSGSVAYDLPGSVPGAAKEVLVFVGYWSNLNATPATTWDVWTEEAGATYYKRVAAYGSATYYTLASANLWLPVTVEKKVHLSAAQTISSIDAVSGIWVLGYR